MQKYIKEVFGDYNENNNLIDAKIENINLYKKTNKLQVKIASDKEITLKDIDSFEEYLVNRFKVEKASLDIDYNNVSIEQNIDKEWNNIINYIAKKEPFSKAILSNSKPDLKEKNLTVRLSLKGASFLLAKKFDKGLEHLISNVYNQNYKVDFLEEVDEDYNQKLEQNLKEREKAAFLEMQVKAKQEAEIRKRENANKPKAQSQYSSNQKDFIKKEKKEPEVEENIDENSPLIYGRSLNIKSEFINIIGSFTPSIPLIHDV